MIQLTYDPIDVDRVLAAVGSNQAGAAVLFLGTTREFTNGRQTTSLKYECYPEMAEGKLNELEAEARARWDLIELVIVHRLGHVGLGKTSIAIAVSSRHRNNAFEAGQWLIDTIKEVVPIWKREEWADGTSQWVHPGIDEAQTGIVSQRKNVSQVAGVDPASSDEVVRGPLVDCFGRVHTNLRISVTDRCNIRCFYCMPDENVRFKPRRDILTFEEIERFVRVAVSLGVEQLRITGGEPLVREDLPVLVSKLCSIVGVKDIAMTTNAMLLADQAADLKRAGLKRLNISLDSLSESKFQQITRREGLDRVLEGIFAARKVGFDKIRLNAVAVRGMTDDEIIPLVEFAREHDLQLRFIEFMPLDGEQQWQSDQVISGDEIRRKLEDRFGPLVPERRVNSSQPAVDYRFSDGVGQIGFIESVTQPFCPKCNRLRITAEGQVRNCLFSDEEWDARSLLRGDASDRQIAELLLACVAAKKTGHGIDSPDFIRPVRPMNELGG